MAEIKAIVFDAGGVLLDWSNRDFVEQCCSLLSIKPSPGMAAKSSGVFDSGSCTGKTTVEQDLAKIFGVKGKKKIAGLVQIYREAAPEMPDMIALAKKMREKYKVVLLSNVDDSRVAQWKKTGFLEIFDTAVLSNRERTSKPGKKIFRILIERTGLKPKECVFVDDSEKNIKAAEALGFKVIKFENREQMKNELKKLGVKM